VRVISGLLMYAVAIRFHHAGPSIDYVGLAAAAAASWVGVPGPGEPVLIAAGIFAARHKLELGPVLLTAWAGATIGGIAGWLVGVKAGRAVLTAPGPLRRLRLGAVARGDQVFDRYPVIAVLLTPSWVAGIHHVRTVVYLPTNAVGAALWAAGIGVGAYYIGPTIVDLVQDVGIVTAVAVVVLVVLVVGGEILLRRRSKARRREA
jgi:membrane protein DedA with SNARE-associated domain